MKKITTLVKESDNDMLTEASTQAFQKELDELVNKYADAMVADLQDQLRSKISDVLKKKASKL